MASKERASRPLCRIERLPSWRRAWCPIRRLMRWVSCQRRLCCTAWANSVAHALACVLMVLGRSHLDGWPWYSHCTCCMGCNGLRLASTVAQIEALIRSHVSAHLPPAANVTIRALGFRAHPYTQVRPSTCKWCMYLRTACAGIVARSLAVHPCRGRLMLWQCRAPALPPPCRPRTACPTGWPHT